MPGTERRHSTSSEDANPLPQRQLSQDGTEIIPTRMSKVTTPKPASNPLQFIKTGPCDLYKAAQEQIKKVEEIKKVEKIKDDSEDWQSNLDNWKCSRRKRQEHIIERVVEVKKLELEEYDRNRRRSKTFNEMMEERSSKGGLRKMSILSFSEEDGNDLSDLGITNSKEKSGGDFTEEQVQNESNKRRDNNVSNENGINKSNGHNHATTYDDGSLTPSTISFPEPEEYTYERAIQSYMNFAEAKVKTTVKTSGEKSNVNGNVNFRICSMKKEPGGKIGEKLSEFEQIRLRSKSTNDINGANDAKQLPKVDVLKRRSLFENAEAADAVANKSTDRISKDLSKSRTVKERLFNLEKNTEKSTKGNRSSGEVGPHIKDAISNLEKPKTANGNSPAKRMSNGDVPPQPTMSIKERLNFLEKQNAEDGVAKSRTCPEGFVPVSVKERMSSYDGSSTKTPATKPEPEAGFGFREKSKVEVSHKDKSQNDVVNSITGNSSNICSDSIQGRVKPVVWSEEREIKEEEKVSVEEPVQNVTESGLGPKSEEFNSQTEVDEAEPKSKVELSAIEIIGNGKMSKEIEEPRVDAKANLEKNEDYFGDEQEDSSAAMYTEENIEEVLGKDDEVEEDEEEVETMVDEEPQYGIVTEETKIQKELEIFTPKDGPEVLAPLKPVELSNESNLVCADYENVFIMKQMPQLCLSPDSDQYGTLSFPLGPRPMIEPPKEKPPPPPVDLSEDESNKPELPPKVSLRRLDSTKRIKKEIRKKRSDFLGIEGPNDDSYLEPEIYVAPPPDMMTFLQEEKRLEQQLYRQSICSESDSNHETAESRDSGVELDRGHVDDICWSKPDVMSEPHSRQNSETFGNTSITSEEDEILKKEREIIEVLEKEEQWRYGNKNSHGDEQNDIGEKLAVKLRQLEQEKMQLERERAEEEDRRKAEETARRRNEQQLIAKQQQLRQQENSISPFNKDSSSSSTVEQENLRFECERLHKEQEHLERCRQNLMEHQQNIEPVDVHHRINVSNWDTPSNRHSLQEVPLGVPMVDVPRHSMQDVSQPQYSSQMSSGYRYSLPDLQQRESKSVRTFPPIPPPKPTRPMTQEQWEREANIRNSRIPSADNIPLQTEASTKLRHGSSVPAINIHHGGQQMTRSTLHALSAVPRSRLISNENWMQPKRKVDAPKSNYNYQHWLIQEAEHRRIFEHQQKVSQQQTFQTKRNIPYSGQTQMSGYNGSPPSHHTVGLPITSNQSNQKWISPLRADKPLPDAVIQTLTQRVQNRENKTPPRRRTENSGPQLSNKMSPPNIENHPSMNYSGQTQERMLSVSGKKKCSHCNEELGRGAAMIIESLRLFYHIDCFKCCVCHVQLGDGRMGTDVRVRNNKLHCHNCYSSDDGVKFSCV